MHRFEMRAKSLLWTCYQMYAMSWQLPSVLGFRLPSSRIQSLYSNTRQSYKSSLSRWGAASSGSHHYQPGSSQRIVSLQFSTSSHDHGSNADHSNTEKTLNQSLKDSENSTTISGFQTYPYKQKSHNSVEINLDELHIDDIAQFGVQLWMTISHLMKEKKSCVYLKVHIENAHLIPIAGNYGFKYHHAEDSYATLLLWIDPSSPCRVPPFATHLCGVGAVIIDDQENILVVLEKRNQKIVGWKLPGGYVQLGEEFSDAAIREVFEETGVKTEFVELLTVRHSHKTAFDRSDVYTICRLKPLSTDIKVDDEIADAKWMPLEEYRSTVKQPMLRIAIDLARTGNKGLKETTIASIIPGRLPYKLYYHDANESK